MARRSRASQSTHPSIAPLVRSDQSPVFDNNAQARASRSAQLRVFGYTYDQIASMCGYKDASGAYRAVKRLRARTIREDSQVVAALQAERIEHAINVCMEWIEQQPAKDKLWALDRLAPLLKRQAELLGLDAPAGSARPAAHRVKAILRGSEQATSGGESSATG